MSPAGPEHDPYELKKHCEDATFDDAIIMCNTDKIGIKIPKCAFHNAHIGGAFLGLNEGEEGDDACAGEEMGDYIVYSVDGTNCGTIVDKNDTHLLYNNHVAGTTTWLTLYTQLTILSLPWLSKCSYFT